MSASSPTEDCAKMKPAIFSASDLFCFADCGDMKGYIKGTKADRAGDNENHREDTENDRSEARNIAGQVKDNHHNGQ